MDTTISPKEFVFYGFVKAFDLAVLFWSMGVIYYYFNANGFAKGCYFVLAAVINPDPLDFKWCVFNQIFDKINCIVSRFPVIHFSDYEPGTIVNSVKTTDLSTSPKWIAGI